MTPEQFELIKTSSINKWTRGVNAENKVEWWNKEGSETCSFCNNFGCDCYAYCPLYRADAKSYCKCALEWMTLSMANSDYGYGLITIKSFNKIYDRNTKSLLKRIKSIEFNEKWRELEYMEENS